MGWWSGWEGALLFRRFWKGKIVLDVITTDTPNIPPNCVYSSLLSVPFLLDAILFLSGRHFLDSSARIPLLYLYAEADDESSGHQEADWKYGFVGHGENEEKRRGQSTMRKAQKKRRENSSISDAVRSFGGLTGCGGSSMRLESRLCLVFLLLFPRPLF
ncbi:hypothetical protein VTG60DRAFT_3068 [Thermothelomyces hinnuleus]